MGLSIIANTLLYTDPVPDPPIYEGLMKLPALQVNKGLKNMTTLSIESGAMVPKGARSLYRTQTIKSTEDILKAIHRAWNEAVPAIKDVSGISWVLSSDPIPPSFYAQHAASNTLGLTGRDGSTLFVLLLDIRWTEESDDKTVTSISKWLFDKIKTEAQALGAHDPFIYLNYAGPDQDPILTYGAENVKRLRATQSRVDPSRLFTL